MIETHICISRERACCEWGCFNGINYHCGSITKEKVFPLQIAEIEIHACISRSALNPHNQPSDKRPELFYFATLPFIYFTRIHGDDFPRMETTYKYIFGGVKLQKLKNRFPINGMGASHALDSIFGPLIAE